MQFFPSGEQATKEAKAITLAKSQDMQREGIMLYVFHGGSLSTPAEVSSGLRDLVTVALIGRFVDQSWIGVYAPAGTPAPVAARAEAAITKALESSYVQGAFQRYTIAPGGSPVQSGSAAPGMSPSASNATQVAPKRSLRGAGWSRNSLGVDTKDVISGSGPEATMSAVASVSVDAWFYDENSADFKSAGQRRPPGGRYECNPRSPEHALSRMGELCEATLGMKVGGRRLVVGAIPGEVREIELLSVAPSTSGRLTQTEAERFRRDALSGQTSACDPVWAARRQQAIKDGLTIANFNERVVFYNAYVDAQACQVIAKDSFLGTPNVRQILSIAPPYNPGTPIDLVKLRVTSAIRDPLTLPRQNARSASDPGADLIGLVLLNFIALAMANSSGDGGTSGNCTARCRNYCESQNPFLSERSPVRPNYYMCELNCPKTC
jgi:hypothetical protein